MIFDKTILRKRVFLMRHGSVSYFDENGKPVRPDQVNLTEKGREQVTATGQALSGVKFDRVLCSGLPRTIQTAEIVLNGAGQEIEMNENFKEIHLGRLKQVPADKFESHVVYGLFAGEGPGGNGSDGEKITDFNKRIQSSFCNLIEGANTSWQNLLLVAHSAVNRSLCCWATGSEDMFAFEQDEACLNILDIDICKTSGKVKRKRLKLLNFTAYDENKSSLGATELERTFSSYMR